MEEKPSILLTDYYYPFNGRMVKGYLLIENGLIEELGEGDPPPDIRSSDMHYPGGGALLLPGISSMITHISLYPFRGMVGEKLSFGLAWSLAEDLSEDQIYVLARAVLKNLVERGVTLVLSYDPYPRAIAKAISDTGLRGIVVSLEGEEIDFPGIKTVYPEKEGDLKRLEDENGGTRGFILRGKEVTTGGKCLEADFVGIGHNATYDPRLPCSSIDAWILISKLSIGPLSFYFARDYPLGLSKGFPADLYTVSPFTGLTTYNPEFSFHHALRTSYHSPVIETVMVNGDILVDGGQQLVVERVLVSKAASIGAYLQSRILEAGAT